MLHTLLERSQGKSNEAEWRQGPIIQGCIIDDSVFVHSNWWNHHNGMDGWTLGLRLGVGAVTQQFS